MTADELPTVLVVDDERSNRLALAELLKDDCRIVLAKDGPTALQRVHSEPVSLILLDASMPGMDGYEVLRRLKADERTANIGVIFITGQTEEEDEERGLVLGAADYVGKPIRPLLVRARVLNHLKFARQRETLERLSMQDGLTGIANRRCFDQSFERACRQAMRSGEAVGLAMIDVDDFKAYNDRYGHGAGDEALRRVARVLAEASLRPYDLAARYGGEEFVLLLPGGHHLAVVLEQVRERVAALGIPHEAAMAAPHLTVSAGGVIAARSVLEQPQQLLSWCDEALYRAKDGGRNRVILCRPTD